MKALDQYSAEERYNVVLRNLIFLFYKDEVLLIKGNPKKRLWANKYNGIGGHVEKGEDILSAANRELNEETGLKNIPLWMCGTIIVDSLENQGVGILVFKAHLLSKPTLKSGIEGELEWIEMKRINDIPLVEDLYYLLPLIKEWRKSDNPFSALYSFNENGKLEIILNSHENA